MHAYFLISDKQYSGEKGSIFYTDYLNKKEGETVVSEKVIVIDGTFGTPYIKNAKVECKVLKEGKQKKVCSVKFISQKRHKRWKNYRTLYTKLEIINISWQK